jgi:hypothetical protein
MAAAYVSATLALEAAAAPSLPMSALRDVLVQTAHAGAIDAARAVRAVKHRRAR